MNPLIPLRRATPLFFIALSVLYFGILPKAQAVIPPPDGGYPRGNTAEGQNALLSLTTGGFNTALGWLSLRALTTGSFNTGVGAGTLVLNSGDENTATGTGALLLNTTGAQNTATGAFALFSNTEGIFNTATGDKALFGNTTGVSNTATGSQALYSNTTGNGNTANGNFALYSNTEGDGNTANGNNALAFNTSAGFNTAIGTHALFSNTTGEGNAATGYLALANNTEGVANTANGVNALASNTIGDSNTAIGVNALFSNITGNINTAVGNVALFGNTTGSVNTAVGPNALGNNTTGSYNTALGYGAGLSVSTANNVICIGTAGANVDNTCFIGNIFGQTSASGAAVYVNSNHRLGTLTSSGRFKDDIKPMEQLSEALFALKPVSFHYKKEIDPAGMQQFGLVAEDVEKVNPDLVVRDKDGKPYSVRYEHVNAMLLNEFLKEHRRNQEQEATIAELKKQMETVVARLKEHDSKIQKVTAQIELSKPIGQTVRNNP